MRRPDRENRWLSPAETTPDASRGSDNSRRRFLTKLGALGIATVFPAGHVGAQTTSSPMGARPSRIDVHHHMLPPAYLAITQERIRPDNP